MFIFPSHNTPFSRWKIYKQNTFHLYFNISKLVLWHFNITYSRILTFQDWTHNSHWLAVWFTEANKDGELFKGNFSVPLCPNYHFILSLGPSETIQSYTIWHGYQTIGSECQIYLYAFGGRNQQRVTSYNFCWFT